jgi:hypothetical protein
MALKRGLDGPIVGLALTTRVLARKEIFPIILSCSRLFSRPFLERACMSGDAHPFAV